MLQTLDHHWIVTTTFSDHVQIIIVHIKDNITLKYLLSTPNILLDNIYYLVYIH